MSQTLAFLSRQLIATSRNDLNNAAHGLSYHIHASMHLNLMRFSAPMNLQLAQKHYQSRFLELRDLIMAEELKFKLVQWFYILGSDDRVPSRTILREIEEIKNLRGEAVNQRQEEEEEETHRDTEGKEEEEASKGEDDKKDEEEGNKKEEGQEEIKPLEERADQEEMESDLVVEEGEGEESKEEETEANPEAVENSQEKRVEEGEGEEGEEEETEATPMAVDNSQERIEEGEGEEEKEEETEANPDAADSVQERHSSPQEQDKTDVVHEDDQTNLVNNAELDIGSESEIAATPPEIPVSPNSLNQAEVVDDEHTSGDEHVMFTRRAHYQKKKDFTFNVHF